MTMLRSLAGSLMLALVVAHAVVGSRMADPDSMTLVIEGLGSTSRWLATQLLGASIAGYGVAALSLFAFAVPTSWKGPAIAIAATSSALLGCIVSRAGIPWSLLTMLVVILTLGSARVYASRHAAAVAP